MGALLILLLGLLSGCSTLPLGEPQASLDNLERIRRSPVAPLDVGAFTRGAGVSAADDKSHGVRSNSVVAPRGSFAAYLGETLRAELSGAGRYQRGAPLVLRGQLLETTLDGSSTRQGTASLAARFELLRDQSVVYRSELRVADRWDSAFIGVEAIPAAVNHYQDLYRRLVGQLFGDAKFIEAARAR
nr:hypothetical protein [Panacagrimonas sp.]